MRLGAFCIFWVLLVFYKLTSTTLLGCEIVIAIGGLERGHESGGHCLFKLDKLYTETTCCCWGPKSTLFNSLSFCNTLSPLITTKKPWKLDDHVSRHF